LDKLYASSDLKADGSLQIMTIHKAKGLEFDTVIVPGLGRAPRNSVKQLLRWMEQPQKQAAAKLAQKIDLLLAPIQKTGEKNDSIYEWIEKLECDKEQYEIDRLLYVVATRTKKFLHLLGHTKSPLDNSEKSILKEPLTSSLLYRLWPSVQPVYKEAIEKLSISGKDQSALESIEISRVSTNNQNVYRLSSDWILPNAPKSLLWQRSENSRPIHEEIEFSWASEMARQVGNVVHRWLQQIAADEMRGWDPVRVQKMQDQFRKNLFANGMSGDNKEISYAVDRITFALTNAINDERGKWILGSQYLAQNELRITGIMDDLPVNWVIDRTFCESNGIRWIIDYKTSSHEGSDIEGFLDREQIRYQHQLNRYAKLMRQMDPRPIKLGIYFPLICGWREW
jgi:ATP-dependent exoDNAse (exonuclease V) beta subunit